MTMTADCPREVTARRHQHRTQREGDITKFFSPSGCLSGFAFKVTRSLLLTATIFQWGGIGPIPLEIVRLADLEKSSSIHSLSGYSQQDPSLAV